ncbi:TPA: hypothetical protein ACXDAM_002262 [Clostridium botulinum]|nr:hypothetical protein [Clostridium botulinum]
MTIQEAIQEFEKSLKGLSVLLKSTTDRENTEIIINRIEATELAISVLENSIVE